MRLRLAALITSIVAVLLLGGWFIKRRLELREEREHAAAIERAAREPGVLIPDPSLPPGAIVIELIPAGPSIELSDPATIRFGQSTRLWSPKSRARFEGMGGLRGQRVSVTGDYFAEGAWLDVPAGGSGARIALRAIPIDPPRIGPPFERQLEVSGMDPSHIILLWKVTNIVVAETKVPRAAPPDALAAAIKKDWEMLGSHRDPSDRRIDRAVVRFEPGALFHEIFPLVDAILATKRTMALAGEARVVPAFDVSVQPALPSPRPRSDLDMERAR